MREYKEAQSYSDGAMADTRWATLLFLACLVAVAGGFAPSLDLPRTTTEPPTTTQDAATLPYFRNYENNTNVSFPAGDTAALDCQVFRLGEKTVSWIRRKDDDIHLLTFGFHTYHNDNRYALNYEYPDNWKLQIRYVQARDEGTYECQVSTHPPKIRRVYLKVTVPGIEIRDKRGSVVTEKFYQIGSRIALQCVVIPAPPRTLVTWTKGSDTLDQKVQRQLSIKTSLGKDGITSWLHMSHARVQDTGNYTCSAAANTKASVRVHVLDGESSAAMQHSSAERSSPLAMACVLLVTPSLVLAAMAFR